MTAADQGIELMRMPAGALGSLVRTLRVEVGNEAAAGILRRMGIEAGAAFYDRFRLWLSESGSGAIDPETLEREVFWNRLSDFFAHLGWGEIEHEATHPGVITLRLSNWVEASQDPSPYGCHFSAGMLAEILRRVAGGDLAALEIESDGGEGGSATVLIGNPVALDSLYAAMRDGAAYGDALAALA